MNIVNVVRLESAASTAHVGYSQPPGPTRGLADDRLHAKCVATKTRKHEEEPRGALQAEPTLSGVKSDSDTRLPQNHLVSRLEANAPGPSWDRYGSALSHDSCSVSAPVIVQAEKTGTRLAGDVRVLSRDTLVDVPRFFGECHVVGSY